MPCELVARGPMWLQTFLPPVFPGLLGILGAPVDGLSCQSIAGSKGYETTKERTQGTVGPAARQAAITEGMASRHASHILPRPQNITLVCHASFPF